LQFQLHPALHLLPFLFYMKTQSNITVSQTGWTFYASVCLRRAGVVSTYG
jgi:hypothetical protein